MKSNKIIKTFEEHSENLNISDVSDSKINEMYRDKPSEETSRLMFEYGVDILPSGIILKDGKEIGEIKQHMIPSGKYYIKDLNKKHIDLKDSYEEALKSLIN